MKGKNEIHINNATMCEAINLWLADQFKSPPKATSVRKDARESGNFIIQIETETSDD